MKRLLSILLLLPASCFAASGISGGTTGGGGISGVGTGGGSGTNTTTVATNYVSHLNLTTQSAMVFTNSVFNAFTNAAFSYEAPGFSYEAASGTLTVSNAGTYVVNARFAMLPTAAADTNKTATFGVYLNDAAVSHLRYNVNSGPIGVESAWTISGMLTNAANARVQFGLSPTAGGFSVALYGVSFTLHSNNGGNVGGGSGDSTNGLASLAAVAATNAVAIAGITTLSNAVSNSRSTVWNYATGMQLPFTRPGTNAVQIVSNSGTNSYLPHGTTIARINGTNYLFVIGRQQQVDPPEQVRLWRFLCDDLTQSASLLFTNYSLYQGAEQVTYANGKLYIPWATTNTTLTISEIDPLAFTWSDFGVTDSKVSTSIVSSCATSNKLFVGTAFAGFFAFDLATKAVLYSTNWNTPPPLAYPGFFHSMVYDGEFVWGAGYISRPGVCRINPDTYDVNVYSVSNMPTDVWATETLAKPTDDLCALGNWVYISPEDTNGIVTRVHRYDGTVQRIKTGVACVGFGTFAIGKNVWVTYPQPDFTTTNRGLLVRIDPETLVVDKLDAPFDVNECVTDGTSLFVTTYSLNPAQSTVAKIPVPEFAGREVRWANTNGSYRLELTPNGGLNVGSNLTVPEITLSGTAISNWNQVVPIGGLTNGQQDAVFAGGTWTRNTNDIQVWGGGQVQTEGRYRWANTTPMSWTNTTVGRSVSNLLFYSWTAPSNVWSIYQATNRRYVFTNATPESTNGWVVDTGTAPAPAVAFHGDVIYRGTANFTNEVVANLVSAKTVSATSATVSNLLSSGPLSADSVTVSTAISGQSATVTSNLNLTGSGTFSGTNTFSGGAGAIIITNGQQLIGNVSLTNSSAGSLLLGATGGGNIRLGVGTSGGSFVLADKITLNYGAGDITIERSGSATALLSSHLRVASTITASNGFIAAPSWQTLSRTWAGLTNSINLLTNRYTLTATTNFGIDSVSGVPLVGTNTVSILTVTASGADRTCLITNIAGQAWASVTVTNNTTAYFMVDCTGGSDTNVSWRFK